MRRVSTLRSQHRLTPRNTGNLVSEQGQGRLPVQFSRREYAHRFHFFLRGLVESTSGGLWAWSLLYGKVLTMNSVSSMWVQLLRCCFLWAELFFFLNKFIYLFLAVLGLRFCARDFSSCGEQGPLFIAVRGPLTIAASLVAEHRLQTLRLSSCGSQAQLLRGMWDPPRPGLEPVFPALAGRLSTTAPPGKPLG